MSTAIKTQYYTATSLDGFIATEDEDVYKRQEWQFSKFVPVAAWF